MKNGARPAARAPHTNPNTLPHFKTFSLGSSQVNQKKIQPQKPPKAQKPKNPKIELPRVKGPNPKG